MKHTFEIIWPPLQNDSFELPRTVTSSYIRMQYAAAVANDEITNKDLTDVVDMARELDDAGIITLKNKV